jgi:hypothetical protein
MCKQCIDLIGNNYKELLDIQLDCYEFKPLTILRNVPLKKKKRTLEKILKILCLPEYFVVQEFKDFIRKVDATCGECPIDTIFFSYYRIVEDKDYKIVCKHIARDLKTHTLCNFCGVRYLNNGVITQNGKKIKDRFKCFLCIEKKKIIDSIT